jgi:ferrous iron transport protein B
LSTLLSKLQSDKVSQEPVFHIALPRWRKPQFGAVIQRAYVQARDFLLKAGPHILWISLLLWFISNYPNQTDSYAIKLGKWLEPIFYPMGIDWKVGVALLFAFAAREVFVPALALIFSQQVTQEGLLTMLGNATFENSEKLIFTPATVIGLIVFFMVSLQCLSTVAVAKKEMGSFKYPAFLMIGYTLAGYILSVGVVQGLRLLGIP